MPTFQNDEKYGPLLSKKETNDLVVSCVFYWLLMSQMKFIIFVLNPFIWWFYTFAALKQSYAQKFTNKEFILMHWVEIKYIWINFPFCVDSGRNNKYLELQTFGEDRRLVVSNSAESMGML